MAAEQTPPAVNEDEILDSIDAILAADEVKYDVIPIGSQGKKIRIGSLSAGAMVAWTESNEGPEKKTSGLRLIQESLVDSKGNRIGKPEHIKALESLGHQTVEDVLAKVLKLNGLKIKGVQLEAETAAKKD